MQKEIAAKIEEIYLTVIHVNPIDPNEIKTKITNKTKAIIKKLIIALMNAPQSI